MSYNKVLVRRFFHFILFYFIFCLSTFRSLWQSWLENWAESSFLTTGILDFPVIACVSSAFTITNMGYVKTCKSEVSVSKIQMNVFCPKKTEWTEFVSGSVKTGWLQKWMSSVTLAPHNSDVMSQNSNTLIPGICSLTHISTKSHWNLTGF